ncbi:hypothetical protein M378DRAFT_90885 [Amanita muscaria Koide BX008]|uniref:Uncharacterized protein n=1 Tax=Amanita muscaria (strain Koide BX008) TaxID=946122 RepID=A0A0C2W2Z3_AMAMK|nr:hypothetical protein M378DRAFT_90885 [Amanita muscaria Koide BX008]
MGRPQLHYTPEEKQAANRAKSKRHYERYKLFTHKGTQVRRIRAKNTVQVLLLPFPEHTTNFTSQSISYWCKRVAAIQDKLRQCTAPSSNAYVAGLYDKFMKTADEALIDRAVAKVQSFRKQLLDCEHNILQLAGVGKALDAVHEIVCEVGMIIKCLEEILCLAMTDISELVNMHEQKQLLYQI